MLTLIDLKALYNANRYNELYKDVRRYGTITNDVNHETVRVLHITHHNVFWDFELVKGEVVHCGYCTK